jgi:hypothetical protein
MKIEKIRALSGFIDQQQKAIDGIQMKILSSSPNSDEQAVYLAYQLHNLYCAYEDIFKEIAQTFENQLDDQKLFHKSLLRKMTISVEGFRPGVIGSASFEFLSELLGFRHVFRHAYQYNLDPGKLNFLKNRLMEAKDKMKEDIARFREFLREQSRG